LEGGEDVISAEQHDVGLDNQDLRADPVTEDVQVDRAATGPNGAADATDALQRELPEIDPRGSGGADGTRGAIGARVN
jgi:hypothetical protein